MNCSLWLKQKGRKVQKKNHENIQFISHILRFCKNSLPFVNPFVSDDIFHGFKHRNGAEVAEKDVPPEVHIIGNKKYLLKATKLLAGKLKDT